MKITPHMLFVDDVQTTVYKMVIKNGGVAEYERVLKSYNDTGRCCVDEFIESV